MGEFLAVNTKEKYCNANGEYVEERKKLHKSIIDYYIEDYEENSNNPPKAILLGGGSASGKSTLSKFWIEIFNKEEIPLVYIDCDEIKSLIPEYEDYKRFNVNKAAYYVHDESSDIAAELLEQAIRKKKNILYDGTMKNLKKYRKLVGDLSNNGYYITLNVVDVPIPIARERAKVRAEKTHRDVPDDILVESHQKVPITFKVIKELVDEYGLFDTSNTTNDVLPYLVTEKNRKGEVIVYDKEKLDRFYDKGSH